jgi:NADPH-dependent 2,4-dienoyl-CoA reductase/sulfur reductase-like enzyme
MATTRASSGLVPDPHALLSLFSTHITAGKREKRRQGWDQPDDPFPTRVFVLGENERRVTLYSQQCRALNLIWLLHETKVLGGEQRRLAVVGAGAGGLTAAAAAACKGADVVLLNDSAEAMPLQRFAWHRWLHPHIFDWPAEDWWEEDADLPLLNWSADDAHSVREKIRRQFDMGSWRGRIDDQFGVEVAEVLPAKKDADHAVVRWMKDGKPTTGQFHAVVLAVGFGSERCKTFVRPPVYRDSYWDDPGRRWTAPGHVLISGGGDGGLTEVLHAALGERFHHSQIVGLAGYKRRRERPWLLREHKWLTEIRGDVEAFEQRWRHRQRPPATQAEPTMEFFRDLPVADCDTRLGEMREERSAATHITLIVSDGEFAATSCALNRFLAARLKKYITIRHGKVDPDQLALRGDPPYAVELDPCCDGEPPTVHVKSVVIRHGAGERPLKSFDKITPDVSHGVFAGTTGALLDATRRLAPETRAFFESCAPGSATTRRLPPDPDVLVERTGAYRAPISGSLTEVAEPARVVIGAMEAAGLVGRALTQAGIERVVRIPAPDVPPMLARAFGDEVRGRLSGGLSVDDEYLKGRREPLARSIAEAARQELDPVADSLALGHGRAGGLAGVVAHDDPSLAKAMLVLLGEGALPWWTTYGYAAARYDDLDTQLAFVRQVVRRARAYAETPDEAWDAAFTALRRAITLEHDRRQRAEVLIETALFVAEERGYGALRAFTGAEKSDARGVLERERRAIATLVALEAMRPTPRPAGWLGAVSPVRRQLQLGKRLRVERLSKLAQMASTPLAADVLSELAQPETDSITALSITWARDSVTQEVPSAMEQVRTLLRP